MGEPTVSFTARLPLVTVRDEYRRLYMRGDRNVYTYSQHTTYSPPHLFHPATITMNSRLSTSLPWTSSPLIINAPMASFAGPDLAVAVTKAGGLGQIGVVNDITRLEAQLKQAASSLLTESERYSSNTLPIGVGLLPFILEIDSVLPVLAMYNPAVIWLFAAKHTEDYTRFAGKLRQACPNSQIWIQVGSVAVALELANACQPDALVLQGIDAGGHGFEKGASIISLLPEVTDSLLKHGFGHIPLIASGGIVDGRAAAAALVLGASGVVMGTRFLAAKETLIHPKYQAAVLKASDGGQSTVRAKVFDELSGANPWPVMYDGRSLVTRSYTDHANGMGIEELRQKHAQALADEKVDMGWGESNRATAWAGTGVGLVNAVQPAADIVEEVRAGAREALNAARAIL
jgi:nitronate monooxygenase